MPHSWTLPARSACCAWTIPTSGRSGAHRREALARERALDLGQGRRAPDEIRAGVAPQDAEWESRCAGGVGRRHARVRVLLDLERRGPVPLDRIAEPVQGADARVAAPREHELARAAGTDQLVVDQVGGHPDQREVAPATADQLVPRRVRDEMGEALERDGVAVAHEVIDRIPECNDLGHGQKGNGRVPLCTVTQRSSVNSCIEAVPPKRPQPLSLTPPNGICGSSWTGWSLTCTMPASMPARARARGRCRR